MAEVYVITNKINGKQYVGKTNRTTKQRLVDHKKEMSRSRSAHRPLYRAFNKYGFDNFELKVIETNLTPEEAEQKEIDLIDKLGTFNKGYNATIGGDGKTYRLVSEKEIAYIVDLYVKEEKTLQQISDIIGADHSTISNRLKEAGVSVKNGGLTFIDEPITTIKDGIETSYKSVGVLIDYLIENKFAKTTNKYSVSSSIKRCLDGKRNTYLGYTFRQ